jgi:hypothetical protein
VRRTVGLAQNAEAAAKLTNSITSVIRRQPITSLCAIEASKGTHITAAYEYTSRFDSATNTFRASASTSAISITT